MAIKFETKHGGLVAVYRHGGGLYLRAKPPGAPSSAPAEYLRLTTEEARAIAAALIKVADEADAPTALERMLAEPLPREYTAKDLETLELLKAAEKQRRRKGKAADLLRAEAQKPWNPA